MAVAEGYMDLRPDDAKISGMIAGIVPEGLFPKRESPGEWFRSGLQETSARYGINVYRTTPPLFELQSPKPEQIVVLDDDATIIAKVHRKQVHDGVFSVVPCNDQLWSPGKCALCRGKSVGKLRAIFTVYSIERKRRELLLASDELLVLLTDTFTVHGSLRGLMFEVAQSTPPRPGQLVIGDRLTFVRSMLDRLPNLGASGKPFNYQFIQPMSNEAMKQFEAERKSKHPEVDPGPPAAPARGKFADSDPEWND